MAAGPLSPPMASMAMRGPVAMAVRPRALRSGFLRLDDFAAVIMAARLAEVVRQLQLAAVRAFLERRRLQRVMAAAHVALRRRCFSFRNSHFGTCSHFSSTKKLATICAQSLRGRTPRRRVI